MPEFRTYAERIIALAQAHPGKLTIQEIADKVGCGYANAFTVLRGCGLDYRPARIGKGHAREEARTHG